MAILHEHFFHRTISLYMGVFGSVFNNIKVKRQNGQVIKVPISYSAQQKYNVQNDQDANLNDETHPKISKRVPRLGFELVGWQRDVTRMKNRNMTMHQHGYTKGKGAKIQYERVPYRFNVRLDAIANYLDDIYQLFEQIVVYFNPNITVIVKDNPDLQNDTEILIQLQDSDKQDSYEGLISEGRELTLSFNFVLEGYLYMPTTEQGPIKSIVIHYHDISQPDIELDKQVITENKKE